jgi:hypothetical protein
MGLMSDLRSRHACVRNFIPQNPPHSANYISNIGSPFTFGPLRKVLEGSSIFIFLVGSFRLLSIFVIFPPFSQRYK